MTALVYPVPVSLSIAPPMVSKSSLSTVFLKTVKDSLPWFSLTITRCHKHRISALIFAFGTRYSCPQNTGFFLRKNMFFIYCTFIIQCTYIMGVYFLQKLQISYRLPCLPENLADNRYGCFFFVFNALNGTFTNVT